MTEAMKVFEKYKKYIGKKIEITFTDGDIWGDCYCEAFTSRCDDENGDGLDIICSRGDYIIYLNQIADIKIVGE